MPGPAPGGSSSSSKSVCFTCSDALVTTGRGRETDGVCGVVLMPTFSASACCCMWWAAVPCSSKSLTAASGLATMGCVKCVKPLRAASFTACQSAADAASCAALTSLATEEGDVGSAACVLQACCQGSSPDIVLGRWWPVWGRFAGGGDLGKHFWCVDRPSLVNRMRLQKLHQKRRQK